MTKLQTVGSSIFLILGLIGLPFLAEHQESVITVSSSATVDPKQAGRTSILSISRPIGKVASGVKQSLAVKIDSGGSIVAAVAFKLSFPPDKVQVEDVSFSNSFCTIEPTYSINNTLGTVTLTCKANSPGLTAQLGTVATLVTNPLTAGDAAFQFDQTASSVTARGSNRDTLSYTVDSIVSYGETPGNSIIVTSKSHPAGTSCSFKAAVDLAWLKQEGNVSFEYGWSEDPAATPSVNTSSTTLSLPTKAGVTQFFSIRGISDKGVKGPITRYRVVSCS